MGHPYNVVIPCSQLTRTYLFFSTHLHTFHQLANQVLPFCYKSRPIIHILSYLFSGWRVWWSLIRLSLWVSTVLARIFRVSVVRYLGYKLVGSFKPFHPLSISLFLSRYGQKICR
eukprot:sb/3476772/